MGAAKAETKVNVTVAAVAPMDVDAGA